MCRFWFLQGNDGVMDMAALVLLHTPPFLKLNAAIKSLNIRQPPVLRDCTACTPTQHSLILDLLPWQGVEDKPQQSIVPSTFRCGAPPQCAIPHISSQSASCLKC
jgi:hypothetical protein